MKISCYSLLLLGLISTACASGPGTASSGPPATAEPKATVHIDLAKYRPKFEVPVAEAGTVLPAKPDLMPAKHINSSLHPMLDSIAETNKKVLYAQGYRILVYSGNERKQAMDVRKVVTQRLPDVDEYFTYQQPTFRLKIGNFLTRLEARNVMRRITDIAPNAMLVPEQVTINKPTK